MWGRKETHLEGLRKLVFTLSKRVSFGPRTTVPNLLYSSGFLPFIKTQFKTLPI